MGEDLYVRSKAINQLISKRKEKNTIMKYFFVNVNLLMLQDTTTYLIFLQKRDIVLFPLDGSIPVELKELPSENYVEFQIYDEVSNKETLPPEQQQQQQFHNHVIFLGYFSIFRIMKLLCIIP